MNPDYRRLPAAVPTLSVGSVVEQALCWLALPPVMFLFGWFNRIASVIAVTLLAVALVRIVRAVKVDTTRTCALFHPVRLSRSYLLSLLLLLLLMIFCGHGGIVRQGWDWQFRNAVFFDLVDHQWPVVYDTASPRALCYYFAYFLPGALVSKITGLILPGDIVQLLYGFWGAAIAFTLVCSVAGGRVRWWMPVLMILFAGCDTAASTLLALRTPVGDWWTKPLFIYDYYKSYSFVEQISQIFNQSIACWVALPLIYAWRRRPEFMLPVYAVLCVFAPLPSVGIALAAAYWCLRRPSSLLSVGGVAAFLTAGLTASFYLSNLNASSPSVTPTLSSGRIMFLGLWFLIWGVGIWLPFIWGRIKGNVTFLLLLVPALFIPLFAVGDSADLGLRASIPLMIFIFYALIGELAKSRFSVARRVALVAVVCVGSYGAVSYLAGITQSVIATRAFGPITKRFEMIGRLDDRDYNLYYNNFVAEGEGFWWRCLAPARAKREQPASVDRKEERK